ncbi:MAG: diguanylate cyclase [Aestuariivirga sp.]
MPTQLKVVRQRGETDETTTIDQETRERLRLLEAVVDNFPGGIILTDRNLNVVICNQQQRDLLEYPSTLFEDGNPTLRELFHFNAARGEYGPGDLEELVARKMDLVRKRVAHTFERIRPNGQIIEIRGVPLADGGFVTSYVDVTEHRKNLEIIAQLAHHDALTGLANRTLFKDRMDQALSRMRRGNGFAVHFLDLDRFKPINDQFGHEVGDRVLVEVARRLKQAVREIDTVSRFGGDEFVIIQDKVATASEAMQLANRVLRLMSAPFHIEGTEHSIGLSIGIALAPKAASDMDGILKCADAALYECKRNGGGGIRVSGE